ncbi:MAG: MazG nucleotide pyrophosphohydrolase domain-containing protein [Nanoarchaeota archaeon]
MTTFQELYDLVITLRKECPWDREQTLSSFFPCLVEEAEEARQALAENDMLNFKEELGDVLWNSLFLTRIAEEQGLFSRDDILRSAKEKMVRRHPHVFEGADLKDIKSIEERWNQIKEQGG